MDSALLILSILAIFLLAELVADTMCNGFSEERHMCRMQLYLKAEE